MVSETNIDTAFAVSLTQAETTKRAAPVAVFLKDALTVGPAPVRTLESKAHGAGLLGKRQAITHAKSFKRAKQQLGVRSVRKGFGRGGEWFWQLPATATESSPGQGGHLSTARKQIGDTYGHRACSERGADERSSLNSSVQVIAGGDRDPAVLTWVSLVDQLDHSRLPAGISAPRWAAFLTDSQVFLDSPFADRAARLGWSTADLFGFSPVQPLMHLGSAGLLWVLNGAAILELHRD